MRKPLIFLTSNITNYNNNSVVVLLRKIQDKVMDRCYNGGRTAQDLT